MHTKVTLEMDTKRTIKGHKKDTKRIKKGLKKDTKCTKK